MVKKISVFITILGLFFLGIPQFNSKAQGGTYFDGYDEGSNINIVIPSIDMSNDIWLDGNMVSDVYYRFDIIYNGIIYSFFEEIQQLYIDNIIPADTILYIDLNPMYNFIFAKFEDQGNGLYYWTELGTLNPEEPTYIKTIIINKNGLRFKNDNYNGYLQEWLWDDFDTSNNVLGNSLIGYENQISIDYYNYNSGYQDGHWDGSQYGFNQGFIYARDEYGYWDWVNDVWRTAQEHADIAYDSGYKGGKIEGYFEGLEETDATGFTGLLGAVFGGLGGLLAIEILPGIYIGAIIAVPLVFGIIFFILGKRKGD